ncbi:MAG: penicillin-binding protein 1A [Alphaproteobacteria bacterium]|jgi:penicillin-binding protein 1A|nr:penicillin-binding protein 1A [Alphaproteobacteria bacterium]
MLICLISITGIGTLWAVFSYYSRDLPDHKQLATYDPPVVTRLYAGDGRLFQEYSKERRVFVPISVIPTHVISTFLAAEDKNFYLHRGVDLVSTLRALFMNLLSLATERRAGGASTITQQVAKNFLIGNEYSYVRKIKEAIIAFRLENTYTKEKILELYLNEIYLGSGCYGVAAAALHYFNKSLDELSTAEAAFLAGLPKAPNNYHPVRNPERALDRRNWVIGRILQNGLIDEEEAERALNTPLRANLSNRKDIVQADYFSEEVRRELVSNFGSQELYKGGLVVRTTLDPYLQKIADDSLREGLINYDRRHGWLGPYTSISLTNWTQNLADLKPPAGLLSLKMAVVLSLHSDGVTIGLADGSRGHIPLNELTWARRRIMDSDGSHHLGPPVKYPSVILEVGNVILVDALKGGKSGTYSLQQIPNVGGALIALDPHTGRVLALTGGYSYEISEFNRAMQAWRQAGSIFKTFVYMAALEKGHTPTTLVLDEPIKIDLGYGLGEWEPQNIAKKFYGEVTLRTGLEKSHNVTTVRLAQDVGLAKISEIAKRFGVNDSLPPQWAMALGAGETTLLRLTAAYAVFANGGKKVTPTFIDRIQDRRGNTIFRQDKRTCEQCQTQEWSSSLPPQLPDIRKNISDPAESYQMVSILKGAVENGTSRRGKVEGFSLAAKTGSTNNFRDAWTVGFSPNLVVGVFIGHDNPRPLGKFEPGGIAAAPIFGSFMRAALKGTTPVPFRTPPGLRFKRMNPETGKIASPGDRNVILEGYKPGTEPTLEGQNELLVIGKEVPFDEIEADIQRTLALLEDAKRERNELQEKETPEAVEMPSAKSLEELIISPSDPGSGIIY